MDPTTWHLVTSLQAAYGALWHLYESVCADLAAVQQAYSALQAQHQHCEAALAQMRESLARELAARDEEAATVGAQAARIALLEERLAAGNGYTAAASGAAA